MQNPPPPPPPPPFGVFPLLSSCSNNKIRMAAISEEAAKSTTVVDESLWWDSFVDLFNHLQEEEEEAEEQVLKKNHTWFLQTLSMFKPPNQNSSSALSASSSSIIKVGSQQLILQPQLKQLALQLSSTAGLDEVQSYILVHHFLHKNHHLLPHQISFHMILLQYYIERQCLLKCTRQIIMHALYSENDSKRADFIIEEASKLISDGLDRNLLSILQDLFFSKHSENMEVDLATLWAEETLIEDNLILDILFLAYYESLCVCNGEQWKNLCSLYKGVLSRSFKFQEMAISFEAKNSLYHSKVQLLLILVATLDLESLLQLVHDEVPFRQGHSVFTLSDIQEMDAMISSFSTVDTEESGPLVLAWAVFICLISSLPEKQQHHVLKDIDHVGYVQQAFKTDPLSSILEIIGSDILKDSDGPITGYRSVLRTFISAFIASYEITQQFDNGIISLILEILCKIYRGEESLCVQFWDKESFIDGPIRCLLNTLEIEFPHRVMELIQLLSALCEGTWPAECVYNFLDSSVGISSVLQVPSGIFEENISQIIEAPQQLHVPEIEDLLIPSRTHGRVIKVLDRNTALVRWEYRQSGVFVLLLRLARQFYMNHCDETQYILDLLCRLVSFNKAVCSSLMDFDNSFSVQTARVNGHVEKSMRVDVVEIICTVVSHLSPNIRGVVVMSKCIGILAEMLKCSPSHVSEVVLKKNIFDVALKKNDFDVRPNECGMWMLSGGLARMLSIDCEQTEDCSLTLSVLDFTKQLIEIGAEDDVSMPLVVFCLHYILVNHELWKYKVKHARWKVTLKVLELMMTCIKSIPVLHQMGHVIGEILLCDSSVCNTLCRIMCVTSQALENIHVSRLYEVEEIKGLQMAVCSVLDVVFTMLTAFPKDTMPGLPVFHQAMLSSTTRPIPVVTATMSLMSYFGDPAIQVCAAKVFSILCIIAESAQPYLFGNVSLLSDDKQVADLRYSIYNIVCGEAPKNEDLLVASLQLLTSAARHQPAFLISVIAPKENDDGPLSNVDGIQPHATDASLRPLKFSEISIVKALLRYVERAEYLIERNPRILLNVLLFLKVLWQAKTQYMHILELFKASGLFWKPLSTILQIVTNKDPHNLSGKDLLSLAYKYQCCSTVLEMMAYDLYLEKYLLRTESHLKQTSDKLKVASPDDVQKTVLVLCETSVMENLVKSYASCEYDSDVLLGGMIASSMFLAHVMEKVTIGDNGSLSLSLLWKIKDITKKFRSQTAFSEVLALYSGHGYSEGQELNTLVLNDLYYHIQGELEGRKINSAPFKELAQFMLHLKFAQAEEKYICDFLDDPSDLFVFDVICMQKDLGLEYWDHSNWKASKPIAEKMILNMRDANLMSFLSSSKLCALEALTTILSVYGENLTETKTTSVGKGISGTLIISSIESVCKCLQTTVESLTSAVGPSLNIINFIEKQGRLLLFLVRLLCQRCSENENRQFSLHVCQLVLRTVSSSLRAMRSIIPSVARLEAIVKLFLLILLFSVEFCHSTSSSQEKQDPESVEGFAEISLLSLGMLPILCSCTEVGECSNLSVATMDLILNSFLTSSSWLPIIEKHLPLQLVIQKLRERDSFSSISIVLKFLLTLARVRGGAEMLQTANFFVSLKVLINILLDQKPFFDVEDERGLATSTGEDEKYQRVWGLGLTVVTAMIYSLRNSTSFVDFVDSVIPYFFLEKAYVLFHHLDHLDLPSDEHGKKRARTQKSQTSLTALREIEHSLILICVLAKHRKSWLKAMREMNSQLSERSIHLLAFISRGAQRSIESSSRTSRLVCAPALKEEVELNHMPSFVNCKRGWFSLLPLSCVSKQYCPGVSSTTLVPLINNQPTQSTDSARATHFSDILAIQIYRIAFLLLKFLSLQAKEAANRAEEMGFINLAQFPELPMPEILHGLQDQAIAIVRELCETNKLKQMSAHIQDVCFLMLQIMEMSLYLEFSVAQTCGIRPVLGRVEDFTKEFKMLVQAVEEHSFLKDSLMSLRQIISFVHPGLLQTEGLL